MTALGFAFSAVTFAAASVVDPSLSRHLLWQGAALVAAFIASAIAIRSVGKTKRADALHSVGSRGTTRRAVGGRESCQQPKV